MQLIRVALVSFWLQYVKMYWDNGWVKGGGESEGGRFEEGEGSVVIFTLFKTRSSLKT